MRLLARSKNAKQQLKICVFTISAVKCNQENIIVTADKAAVGAFCKEYDRLWPMMTDYTK